MGIAHELANITESGTRWIGELEIQSDESSGCFMLSHQSDARNAMEAELHGLEVLHGPGAAREISTHTENGSYRFAKAQTNLKRGWVMILKNEEELRQALDLFYPAAVGLFIALKNGRLQTENLRDKLERQTGMYRFAKNISDLGAQKLVQSVCGPAHQCAKRILWQIDAHTPLVDSEASRFNGVPGRNPENQSIPLLCREACNHFVAECRREAKIEFEAKSERPTEAK